MTKQELENKQNPYNNPTQNLSQFTREQRIKIIALRNQYQATAQAEQNSLLPLRNLYFARWLYRHKRIKR